jgi:alpha-tubulin suppressor-like RCC1 family protein
MRGITSVLTLGTLMIGAVVGCKSGGIENPGNNKKWPERPTTAGVSAVAAAGHHTLALMRDGTVLAWGSNGNGQLGDGTNSWAGPPVKVSGLTDAVAIAAGDDSTAVISVRGNGGIAPQESRIAIEHSLALRRDGTVWAWGDNAYGELGNGTKSSSNVPVQVEGLTGATAITAGNPSFGVAIKTDGTVWAWGNNEMGQLGNGTTNSSNAPVQVKA